MVGKLMFLIMKDKILYYLNKIKWLFYNHKKSPEYLQSFFDTMVHKRIVVFDTETTGLDISNDDIIQIAAVEIINGKIGNNYECYFPTEKELSPTQKIHNISNEHLKLKATVKKEGLNQFLNFLSNDALLAHNIKFDYSILNSNLLREGLKTIDQKINPIFCSLSLTRQLYKLPSYKLGSILKSLKIEGVNSHDAMDDTEATVNLAFVLKDKIETLNLSVKNAQG